MSNKKYTYFYPENKALGDQLPRMSGFIAIQLLKGKYSTGHVRDVMKGRRDNKEIVDAMKYLIETSKAHNY